MNRCHKRFSALALISTIVTWSTAQADMPAPPAPTQGFVFPDFQSGYPATRFEYEDADAKRLAIELFPAIADQTVKATVREQVAIPGGGYHGLYIDFVLQPRVERQSICEQPRIAILLRYNSQERFQAKTMQLAIRSGTIAEHDFETVHRTGLYRSLAEPPKSPAAALETCRELARDMAGWKAATDANDFSGQQWRRQKLIGALETLPNNKITCTSIEGKPCSQSRSELIAYFRDVSARHSVGQFVPGEGEINIFDYYDDDLDRDVTMWLDQGRPRTISIRFRTPNRPVI